MKLSRCCSADYLLFIAGILIGTCSASGWSYNHPDDWLFACLTGERQSPINLNYSNTVLAPKWHHPFSFHNYDSLSQVSIANTGHTVRVRFNSEDNVPKMNGGGFVGDYILEEINFHWASEHTINGERYPLELQLLNYDKKYRNFDNATRYHAGVGAFAVLFHLSLDNDNYMEEIIQSIPYIKRRPNGEPHLLNDTFITPAMFLPRDRSSYYRYEGSLTTPACSEGITWTVFTETLPISQNQLEKFQLIWTEDLKPLLSNNRNIQELNNREVSLRNSHRVDEPPSMRILFPKSNGLNLQPFNGYYVTLVALACLMLV